MNILIDFLITNFNKKFGLSKNELEDYMLFQTNNSGVIYNGELLKADNENKFKILIQKAILNNKGTEENLENLVNKIKDKYGSVLGLFNYVNKKINLVFFEDLKNIEELENFKLNFLKLMDELLFLLNSKPKVKGIQLAYLTNILKDSNLLGNWTIKPDRHIDSVVPLLSINNKKMIDLSRDETKAQPFELEKVLPEISKVYSKRINQQKKIYKNLRRKDELEKINIILYAYDYCFQYNLNNEKKINPKLLDRTIFLYSSGRQNGYLKSHKFHEEFCKKTKGHFFKKTKDFKKHIELINSLGF